MEKVEGELKIFSPILIGEYIRQMTAAQYIISPETKEVEFLMSNENYNKFAAAPQKAPLMGLTLSYTPESQTLTVTAGEDFIAQFKNKIMNDMALKYAEDYKSRYASFIICRS